MPEEPIPAMKTPNPLAMFALLMLGGLALIAAMPDETPAADPPSDAPTPEGSELATFGGGCFWCTEAVFEETRGVHSAVSGYSGGAKPNPTYEAICTGSTGHAEVIQVAYDPNVISYAELLEVFFRTHDPTTLNRQGADRGTQYRSVIFFHDEQQKQVAEEVKASLNASGAYNDPIVTEISPLLAFYEAEPYHQDYFAKNPYQGYCRAVIAPKMDKFRKAFADRLKEGE